MSKDKPGTSYAEKMQQVWIHNLSQPADRPLKARTCASFFCWYRWLPLQKGLAFEKGVLWMLSRDRWLGASVHTLGAPADLGMVWINSAGEVVDTQLARRWLPLIFPRRSARFVLQILPARLPEFHFGDLIRFEEA